MTEVEVSLRGRHVYLRPTTPGDYEFLFNIEIAAEAAPRWRFRGLTLSFEQFVHVLHEDVLVSFIAIDIETERPLGSVMAYSADFRNDLASIAAIAAPDQIGSGRIIEGVGLLVDYVFGYWTFRKLYLQTFDFNLSQFIGLRGVLREEARLPDYEFYLGRYWDKVFLSISRTAWTDFRQLVLAPPVNGHASILDFDGLVALLARDLDWDLPVDVNADLAKDCELDSLTLFAFFAMLEDYVGALMPNGVRNQMSTLGDAFHWYRTRLEAT